MGRNLKNVYGNNGAQEWRTPSWFIEFVEEFFGKKIVLDVCAKDAESAVCPEFFTPKQDGLRQNWVRRRGIVWCNPPFRKPEPWIQEGIATACQNTHVVMLLPASIETRWFRRYHALAQKWIIHPRLNFVDSDTGKVKQGVSKPCTLWHFNQLHAFHDCREITFEYLEVRKPNNA